ncbi:MAG: hypothetical protein ACI9CA_001532, partial [Natronomonas sp.]
MVAQGQGGERSEAKEGEVEADGSRW